MASGWGVVLLEHPGYLTVDDFGFSEILFKH